MTPGAKPQAWGVTPQKQQSPGAAPAAQPAPISWLEPASLSAHGQVSRQVWHGILTLSICVSVCLSACLSV